MARGCNSAPFIRQVQLTFGVVVVESGSVLLWLRACVLCVCVCVCVPAVGCGEHNIFNIKIVLVRLKYLCVYIPTIFFSGRKIVLALN